MTSIIPLLLSHLLCFCAPWLEWRECACGLTHKRPAAAQKAHQLHGQLPHAFG